MKQTCYTIYGLRVDPGERTFVELEEEVGQVTNNGEVGYFQAGVYDANMTFLALTVKRVEPGDYVMHPGERPSANQADRDKWNHALRIRARELGMQVIDGPGWFTIPDQC